MSRMLHGRMYREAYIFGVQNLFESKTLTSAEKQQHITMGSSNKNNPFHFTKQKAINIKLDFTNKSYNKKCGFFSCSTHNN